MRLLLFSKVRMNNEDGFYSEYDQGVNYQKARKVATGRQDLHLKEKLGSIEIR